MTKKKILLVEDDPSLAQVLSHTLEFEGFEVVWVDDGNAALQAAADACPDLVLLDVALPGTNGFDLCAAWRQTRLCPIIMLTARNQKEDKLTGFRLGAADYVTKPFDLDELLARIDAVLRRNEGQLRSIVLGDVTVDFVTLRAEQHGEPLTLSHREFELLRYLAERATRAVNRTELRRMLWSLSDDTVPTRVVDQAVAKLRKKIEPDLHRPRFIHTVHGDGYQLTPDSTESR